MATPLLSTKLYAPRAWARLVSRPHLVQRLEAGLPGKLTLISAPAGFGKTTLLSEWLAGAGRPVAWISLDPDDNDPTRFWAYVITALQAIQEGIGRAILSALHSAQPPALDSLLAGLVNELAEVGEPFTLVLDDFHVIVDPRINDAVRSLVDNMPLQMHLILSSRADPPWPLGRLRVRGELAELRARDLRFTLEEAASFLRQVMRLELSPEAVAVLEERTEGWIAGLQMAALSMRGRGDVAQFITSFSGTHRFVLDYLVEEVLDAQSAQLQQFLLTTSILDRMTAPLCDAVSGRADSQSMLAQLEQANLFIVALDDERRWYRYHHLFADLLRSRLAHVRPGEVSALHVRASEWFAQNSLPMEAVRHALVAGDLVRAVGLMEKSALTMMGHGELATVRRWLDSLPGEMVRSRPWLSVARAWALLYAGHPDAVEPLLQAAEEASEVLGEEDQVAHVGGHIAAIRAEAAYVRGEMDRTAGFSQQALERLPPGDSMARGFAAAHLGYALYWEGDLVRADEALQDAYAIASTTGDSYIAVMVLCDLATVRIDRGQLHSAVATAEQALELAGHYAGRRGQRSPSSGHAFTYMARVLLEWNDLPGALRYAREGNRLCRLWKQPETLITSNYTLARVLQASGDSAGALEAMEEATRLAEGLSPWIQARASAQAALIRLAAGDLRAAERWRRGSGLAVDDQPRLEQRFLYRTLARVLLVEARAQSDTLLLGKVEGLLSRLMAVAEPAGANGTVVEALVLQAMTLQALGQVAPAFAHLARALHLAEPEGYACTFIREGLPMGELLRQALAKGIQVEYVRKLLAVLEGEASAYQLARLARPGLPEPLSPRELEVLRLLSTLLSSTEMAQELVISANTVRSHIKNIYGKLGVHSRKDAIARAQELGLLLRPLPDIPGLLGLPAPTTRWGFFDRPRITHLDHPAWVMTGHLVAGYHIGNARDDGGGEHDRRPGVQQRGVLPHQSDRKPGQEMVRLV